MGKNDRTEEKAMTKNERRALLLIEANPLITPETIAGKLGLPFSDAEALIRGLIAQGCIQGRGFVLAGGSYAVVIGGVNMDICGTAFAPLVAEDSNPGRVSYSLGGVGRNIAHNMSLLGMDVRMLTAYGDDTNGEHIAASCSELGIDVSHAKVVPGGTTPTYLYLTGPDGNMALAVNDMDICREISPAYLAANLPLINRAQLIIADANIPAESLAYLADRCSVPIFCDPVSTVKAEKLRPILEKIHTLKPNRLEAQLLSGVEIRTPEDAEKAGRVLLDAGMHRVFISMGADGVMAVTREGDLFLPNLPGKLVNTTGCGDAFMAGLAFAYLEGSGLRNSALAGLAAASLAAESRETINSALSADALRARMALAK